MAARTVVEDETRRNSFWLAYATERQYGCGNGWALFLDDQDVSQLLPVRGDHFERGASVFLSDVGIINYPGNRFLLRQESASGHNLVIFFSSTQKIRSTPLSCTSNLRS